jgi:hypothetical protein
VSAASNSLEKLANAGRVHPGTPIELVPSICRYANAGGNAGPFRAVVVKPEGGQNSIRSEVDGQLYSPQSLLTKLETENGVCGVPTVYKNWRIVGHEKSIWDEANSLGGEPLAQEKEVHVNGEKKPQGQPPVETSKWRRILMAAVKALLVALASALGAKLGGWAAGAIRSSSASRFNLTNFAFRIMQSLHKGEKETGQAHSGPGPRVHVLAGPGLAGRKGTPLGMGMYMGFSIFGGSTPLILLGWGGNLGLRVNVCGGSPSRVR